MKLTKTYLYNITVGGFYQFRVFQVVDAHKQVYYIGERINYGGTVIADTEQLVKEKLEAQVPVINAFWSKIK